MPSAPMDDALKLLHAPLGEPGSGRVRYAAAMELWVRGMISEGQLDAYRDASPHDGRDPLSMLQERNLAGPPLPAPGPATAVSALFAAAHEYLNALSHPGSAEVRAGLARCEAAPVPWPTGRHPVADRWLPEALASITAAPSHLVEAIDVASPHLCWRSYDAYPLSEIGEAFANGHAFASIAGSGAPFEARDFELGLFLIAPNIVYRDHCHPAPELYVPLTGPHGWRFGAGRTLIIKDAGLPVWNPPSQPHLMKVGTSPFLSLFVWTRDVKQPAQVLPAADWDDLEHSPLLV